MIRAHLCVHSLGDRVPALKLDSRQFCLVLIDGTEMSTHSCTDHELEIIVIISIFLNNFQWVDQLILMAYVHYSARTVQPSSSHFSLVSFQCPET